MPYFKGRGLRNTTPFPNSEMNITNRVEKVDEKNGVICLVFMFPSRVMVLKLSKECIFCKFVLTAATNISLLKQFTYMHLKGLIYYALTYYFGDIRIWSWRIFFCWVSIFLIFYLLRSHGGSDPYKPYHFQKECNEKFPKHTWKNFNGLRFLAEIFFGQFKDHNSRRKRAK